MCLEWGVLHVGTWRTLRVPDWRLGGQGHPYVMDDLILPQGRYPESFVLIPFDQPLLILNFSKNHQIQTF